MIDAPSDLCDQLIVDFPTRNQSTVRFASTVEVLPIRSTLTMIGHKEELWYTSRDFKTMKLQRRSDAIDLGRILLAPSDEDLMEGGVHVSQAVGLEKAVNPIQARKIGRIALHHRMAVLRLQEVTDDEGICRISQGLSSWNSERAHTLAKAYVAMDMDK
eukprot:scaffold1601_cov140-Skeletonema_marinoi.AAC.4